MPSRSNFPLGVDPAGLKPGDDPDLRRSATVDALIVIGMQNGFLERHPALLDKVRELTRGFPAEATYWVKFRNMPDSMFTRHLNWHHMMVSPQTDIPPPLEPAPERTFVHTSYDLPKDLRTIVAGHGAVALAGTDTDACIYAAAFNLWDSGVQPVIVKSCCISSRSEHIHTVAIDFMRRQFGPGSIVGAIAWSGKTPVDARQA